MSKTGGGVKAIFGQCPKVRSFFLGMPFLSQSYVRGRWQRFQLVCPLYIHWGHIEVMEVASRGVIEWVVEVLKGDGEGGVCFKEIFQSGPRNPIFCTVVALARHARHAKSQCITTFC